LFRQQFQEHVFNIAAAVPARSTAMLVEGIVAEGIVAEGSSRPKRPIEAIVLFRGTPEHRIITLGEGWVEPPPEVAFVPGAT
jgi:hypothetical protein